MTSPRDKHLAERRASARAWRVRRGGIVALVAMLVQLLAPLVHGPHGSRASDGHRGCTSATLCELGPIGDGSVDQDCDQCPVCQSISHAAQPVVPTIAAALSLDAAPRHELVRAPQARPVLFRVVTGGGPRGPPIGC
jgi:hypothetical protein